MLSRIARKAGGEKIEFNSLRATIQGHLESINKNAQANPLLALQVKKLEMPTIFFVDSMIAESRLSCAAQWHQDRLAYKENELAGDEKFFDFLDETLWEWALLDGMPLSRSICARRWKRLRGALPARWSQTPRRESARRRTNTSTRAT